MIVDKAPAILTFFEMWDVVTQVGEGLNTEVSCCCGSLTLESKK